MAKYQGRTVKLNKPFRQPSGSSKKFGMLKTKAQVELKKWVLVIQI
jgi:hypothetical protein